MANFLKANWKTSLAGAAAFLCGLGHLLAALSNGDTSTLYHDYMALMAGVGLLFAHDQ